MPFDSEFSNSENLENIESPWVGDGFVDGNSRSLVGSAVSQDGHIVNEHGSIIGHADELSEDPEEEVAGEVAETSPVEGKVVSRPGKVFKHGNISRIQISSLLGDRGREETPPEAAPIANGIEHEVSHKRKWQLGPPPDPFVPDDGMVSTPYLVDHLISLWTTVKPF